MDKGLTLKVLGGAQILLDGAPLHALSAIKSRALLIYLTMTGQPHSRDALAGLLWPDMGDAEAKVNLRQALSKMRRLLPDHLLITRHQVALAPTAPLAVDALAIEKLLRAADDPAIRTEARLDALHRAVELYGGDLLAGFFLADAEPFEEWYLAERERLRRAVLHALDALARHHTLHRQIGPGLHYTGKLLQMDPWREETHQQMMRLLAWDGQTTAALSQYITCKEMLHSALGVEPLAQTTALYERLLAVREGTPHNLPISPAPLVGRNAQLAELTAWLHNPDCRLITITGPGGMGKTRLALEVAVRHLPLFLDGIYFVDLSGLDRGDQLAAALARALGYNFSPSQPADQQLLNYLRPQEMLLLLDNFEHLLVDGQPSAALDLLAALLAGAPNLKLIVTSRQRLNLVEEWIFALAGLSYPTDAAAPEVEGNESVRLFAQTAQRSHRHFDLAAEKAAVVEICQLVEGLPLAINLAAGLLPARNCAQIAADLARSLATLSTAAYNVPRRQQSIQATLDYSWHLLTAPDRQRLAILSLFHDGFTAEAAAAVAGVTPSALRRLLHKSWLQQQAGRYGMHELVRLFAATALDEESAHQRHCDYFMAFLAGQGGEMDGPAMLDAVAIIQADLANIRHAWQWATDQRRFSALAQGIDALTSFYLITNQFVEGEQLLARTLDALQADLAVDPQRAAEIHPLLARASTSLARQLILHRRYAEAIETAQQALDWAQKVESAELIVQSILCRGAALYLQGAYDEAQQYIEEGIRLAQQAHLDDWIATGWQYLGSIAYLLADYPQAQHAYERALAHYDRMSPRFPRQRAGLLNNIGNVHLRQGRFTQAEDHYQSALTLRRHVDRSPIGGTVTLNNLGLVLLGQHRYSEALAYFEEALRLYRRAAHRQGESMVLGNLSDLYRQMGDYPRAQAYAEQDWAILQEIGRRSRRGMRFVRLGALCQDQGDPRRALDYARQAIEAASAQGELDIVGYGQTLLGHARAALGQSVLAMTAYRESIAVRRSIGQFHLTLEPLGGLAAVALRQDQREQARCCVDEILAYWAGEPLARTYTAIPIYVTVVEVLRAVDDPRAGDLLREAHDHLQARAAHIADEQMRDSCLHNVDAHRRLRSLLRSE